MNDIILGSPFVMVKLTCAPLHLSQTSASANWSNHFLYPLFMGLLQNHWLFPFKNNPNLDDFQVPNGDRGPPRRFPERDREERSSRRRSSRRSSRPSRRSRLLAVQVQHCYWCHNFLLTIWYRIYFVFLGLTLWGSMW